MADPQVLRNEAQHRFELTIDGHLAELIYRMEGDVVVLVHTEVPEALGGRGLGGHLVSAAVDFAAEHGLSIRPECEFARSWLDRHPDVATRVSLVP